MTETQIVTTLPPIETFISMKDVERTNLAFNIDRQAKRNASKLTCPPQFSLPIGLVIFAAMKRKRIQKEV